MIEHARYVVGESLGEGAQGVVVRVTDRERPDLALAAKIAKGTALDGEFALLARLRIPGLVRVHDFARDAHGVPFVVEELVDGLDLPAWVGTSSARLATACASLAQTLALVHDAGFAHGDVKPANVRVSAHDERPRLLDLGAASPLGRASHGLVCTPAYAAPELLAGAPRSRATDLFSLGATLWACASGGPPPWNDPSRPRGTGAARARASLRQRAPWIVPSLADLIERLVAEHPADRPASGLDVLAALGRSSTTLDWETGAVLGSHVRSAEIERVLAMRSTSRVVFVTGPSGTGKSHLLREITTRLLLAGEPCRSVRFPVDDVVVVRQALERLRGAHGGAADGTYVLDDLHYAPVEVFEAIDAHRCRPGRSQTVSVIAAAREAPRGAMAISLEPLDRTRFGALSRELGIASSQIDAAHRESGGLPGWAVASLGRVALSRDAVLARVKALPGPARDALALIATMGGVAPAEIVSSEADALFVAGLLEREREGLRLVSPTLARDLADALGGFAVSDRAAEAALGGVALPSRTLLAIGAAASPPTRRAEVLALAADRARLEGARAVEIDALLALVADPIERTGARLGRLERLTRDAGTARAHPQVLEWLEALGERGDVRVATLAARRRAEERARAGDHGEARAHARRALDLARANVALLGLAEEAYALATAGAVELFAAAWPEANEAFRSARAILARREARPGSGEDDGVDAEEVARLEHNLGVVALYRDENAAAIGAFERSLAIKRSLGDRAGVRACLLNLGIALTREQRWLEAEQALIEATTLAEALGQAAGRGWCLVARADLEVRRKRARDAERYLAEAEAIGDALPGSVRSDLAILRAAIALLEGNGEAARVALGALTTTARSGDALTDARALVIEARSWLASLPVDRRQSARCAVAALRRARAAGLPEAERDARAALRRARERANATPRSPLPETGASMEEAVWEVLERMAHAEDVDAVLGALASHVVAEARAERVFVASIDDSGAVVQAWARDLDGLPIAEATARIDRESIAVAYRRQAPVYQPDVASTAGAGSRLTVAGRGSAMVVEHRFVRGAFDHVGAERTERWSILADIALRMRGAASASAVASRASSASAVASASASASPSAAGLRPRDPSSSLGAFSTSMPLRASTRDYAEILGRSAALRRALSQLDAAVETDLPVLVHGETGTGKELFARALHEHGERRSGPFVAVNCAAISDALFEAELFGHARGAFTGADRTRPGLLARAEGGTLLLDEIGELPLPRQATLLRALEAKRYRAVGADDERAFDVRIVAATNRDLDAACEHGEFRKDLLYRLRVLDVAVPPLRERSGDVELLLRHFLQRCGSRARITPPALDVLEGYAFPGNVRELLHLAQRLAASKVDEIALSNLPRAVRGASVARGRRSSEAPATADDERAEVLAALERTAGNISRAAVLLGLTRHGLKKRMLRLGLRARAGGA
ncbi:MAG: sigma 54-interacting transcriptional regulator [Deltaproteobacteria bacterium]|nr:sigma 54-interacting transcriptional regulator [Deltaproteobacteria bacterium]